MKERLISYATILLWCVVWLLLIFATAFLGYLGPVAWAYFPVAAALLAVWPYYRIASRWPRFNVGTCLALVLYIFLLLMGEADLTHALPVLAAGILSDVARVRGVTVAYPVLSLGTITWILSLWTRPEWYHQAAIEEMGQDYADTLMPLSAWWCLALLVVLTLAGGYVGIRLAMKLTKT